MEREIHYAMRRLCHRCGAMKGWAKHELMGTSRLHGEPDKRLVLATYRDVLECGHEEIISHVEVRGIY